MHKKVGLMGPPLPLQYKTTDDSLPVVLQSRASPQHMKEEALSTFGTGSKLVEGRYRTVTVGITDYVAVAVGQIYPWQRSYPLGSDLGRNPSLLQFG